MKKIMNKINFALIGLMATVPAFAADSDMCALIDRLKEVFKILRTMAFVGAAFYIAGWAWDFIKGGEAKMDDVKKKSIGLLVGFALLFMIGLILSFILGAAKPDGVLKCDNITTDW